VCNCGHPSNRVSGSRELRSATSGPAVTPSPAAPVTVPAIHTSAALVRPRAASLPHAESGPTAHHTPRTIGALVLMNPAKRGALAGIIVAAIVVLLGLGSTAIWAAAPWAIALAIVAWRSICPPRPLGPPQHRALDDETRDRPQPVEVELVAWELVRRALDARDRSRADAELTVLGDGPTRRARLRPPTTPPHAVT
jgi:hypothetical protein